jgi:hypothetical protein
VQGVCLDNLRGICLLHNGVEEYFSNQSGYGDCLAKHCVESQERSGQSVRTSLMPVIYSLRPDFIKQFEKECSSVGRSIGTISSIPEFLATYLQTAITSSESTRQRLHRTLPEFTWPSSLPTSNPRPLPLSTLQQSETWRSSDTDFTDSKVQYSSSTLFTSRQPTASQPSEIAVTDTKALPSSLIMPTTQQTNTPKPSKIVLTNSKTMPASTNTAHEEKTIARNESSPTAEVSPSNNGGLGKIEVVGIVVGVISTLAVIAGLTFFIIRRRRRRATPVVSVLPPLATEVDHKPELDGQSLPPRDHTRDWDTNLSKLDQQIYPQGSPTTYGLRIPGISELESPRASELGSPVVSELDSQTAQPIMSQRNEGSGYRNF